MRPDLEDFDDLNEQDVSPRSKAMAWLVLGVALCGFTSLAYYAYHSGSQSMRDANVAIVDADPSPIKGAPEDAQGEQFPNKDKTIYDAIAADDRENDAAPVEKLLPEAEQAVVPPVVAEAPRPVRAEKKVPQTTTFVNEASKGAIAENGAPDAPISHVTPAAPPAAEMIAPLSEPVKPVAKAPVKTPALPASVASVAIRASDFNKKPAPAAAKPVAENPAPAPAPAAAPVAVAKEVEIGASEDAGDNASPSAPEMINVKSVTPSSKPTSEIKDAKAKAKAAKPVAVATGGPYKVQLGAFKSEPEALAQWKKIAAKNSDVVGGAPVIVKADLPNGTFYRLRASGYASTDAAKAACAKLASRSQACFPAGK